MYMCVHTSFSKVTTPGYHGTSFLVHFVTRTAFIVHRLIVLFCHQNKRRLQSLGPGSRFKVPWKAWDTES